MRISKIKIAFVFSIFGQNSSSLDTYLLIISTEPNEPADAPPYRNVVKFYSDTGALIYTVPVPFTQVSFMNLVLYKTSSIPWISPCL